MKVPNNFPWSRREHPLSSHIPRRPPCMNPLGTRFRLLRVDVTLVKSDFGHPIRGCVPRPPPTCHRECAPTPPSSVSPRLSECGTHKTVKPRAWLYLSDKTFKVVPSSLGSGASLDESPAAPPSAHLSDAMCALIRFDKSTPSQNRQLDI